MATETGNADPARGNSPSEASQSGTDERATTANAAANVQKSQRISVNISKGTADALAELAGDKDISVTEALRRLVGYGAVVYRATKDGGDILIRRGNQTERVVLVD